MLSSGEVDMPRTSNPQLQRLIETLKAAFPPDAPKLWELPPAEARLRGDAFFVPLNVGGPEMADTRDIALLGRRGSIPARVYVPRELMAPSAGVLYFHGGGFMFGSPDTHDRLTRELAAGLGARVVSLHYGLAPECPYPGGLQDCVDAARWLASHGDELGIDPDRLLIGGDSAGANLTAATLLKLRDERDGPAFRGALLIYGRYAGADTPSITAWGNRDLILSRRLMDWFREHYTCNGVDPGDPYYAPVTADLTGFPPAILVVGTLDPLLSDSELFAAALETAGVPAELHVFEDGIHAFLQLPGLDMTAAAIEKLCAFGRRRLGAETRGRRPDITAGERGGGTP
jgi:acetyl esterase